MENNFSLQTIQYAKASIKFFSQVFVFMTLCFINNQAFSNTQKAPLLKKQFRLSQINTVYRITLKNGTIVDGSTDEKGRTVTVYTNKPESMKVKTFEYDVIPNDTKSTGRNRFVITENGTSVQPIPDLPYRITTANGTVIEGVLDEDGETVTVHTAKPELSRMKILKSEIKKFDVRDAETHDINPCEFNALGPFLKKSYYPDYKIKRKYGSSYIKERVTLVNNIELSVETSACIHGPVNTFSFAVPKAILKGKSPKENLKWLRAQLMVLKYVKDYGDPSYTVNKILKKIDRLKPVDNEKFQEVSLCHNGTIPPPFSQVNDGSVKDECNGDDLFLISIKGIPSVNDFAHFEDKTPLLIQNENKNAWVYGVNYGGTPILTPFNKKNIKQKLAGLKFSHSIQTLKCSKISDEIYREIVIDEAHSICSWGGENSINYKWRETKTHMYLEFSEIGSA
jgi:hypothetical protein